MKTSKALLALYLVIGFLEVINIIYYPQYRVFSKTLLMPMLLLYVLSLNNFKTTKIPLIILAILFAWIGDVILMTEYTFSFLIGLSSFLVMHLFYVILFNQQRAIGVHKHLKSILFITIILIASIWFFWSKTEPIQLPVSIYCIVISSMVLAAFMRWKTHFYWHVVSGSFLFLISDLLLAVNKFHTPFEMADVLVMSTYILGQLLIVHGYVKDILPQ